MPKDDSSESGDSCISFEDYRTEKEKLDHKSSPSGGSSRFNSHNSFKFPPELCNPLPSAFSLIGDSLPPSAQLTRQDRIFLTRMVFEYDKLKDSYGLISTKLEDMLMTAEILSIENDELRLSIKDLEDRLYEVSMNSRVPSRVAAVTSSTGESGNNSSLTSESGIKNQGFDEEPVQSHSDRLSLPKSISIRSYSYFNTTAPSSNTNSNRFRLATTPSLRVHTPTFSAVDENKQGVDDQKKKKDPLELDAYNQGMFKTELCNNWVQTGGCGYGARCRFAHGIRELRPVIRHPSYKTKACTTVLRGRFCTYGHRCHFRHALTDQERCTGVTGSY
ncbi:hypothetical protein MKW92_024190 [Papaver armeniacum]|nr:hypothetical protein MKW92_024190 [Papaver armeniacum]